MIADLPPGLILILGALAIPFIPAGLRRYYVLALPALGLLQLLLLPTGMQGQVEMFGHTTPLQLTDLPVAALLVLAVAGVAAYGIVLGGWSAGSTYPLVPSATSSRMRGHGSPTDLHSLGSETRR